MQVHRALQISRIIKQNEQLLSTARLPPLARFRNLSLQESSMLQSKSVQKGESLSTRKKSLQDIREENLTRLELKYAEVQNRLLYQKMAKSRTKVRILNDFKRGKKVQILSKSNTSKQFTYSVRSVISQTVPSSSFRAFSCAGMHFLFESRRGQLFHFNTNQPIAFERAELKQDVTGGEVVPYVLNSFFIVSKKGVCLRYFVKQNKHGLSRFVVKLSINPPQTISIQQRQTLTAVNNKVIPTGRIGASAVSGKLISFLWGGRKIIDDKYQSMASVQTAIKQVQILNINYKGKGPSPCSNSLMVKVNEKDYLLIYGGYNRDDIQLLNNRVHLFEISTQTFYQIEKNQRSPHIDCRYDHSGVFKDYRTFLVLGGVGRTGFISQISQVLLLE